MLEELRTLLAVVRYATFEAAGAHIGLSQSAVSARIRQLEQRLGMPLFERTGRALRLAPHGQRIVTLAEQMVALAEQMPLSTTAIPLQGRVRLGAIASVQSGLLPAALGEVRARAPGLVFQLVPGVSLSLLDQVDRGALDGALMIRPPFALPASLHGEVFHTEPFVLVTPAAIPASDPLTILRTYPFIQYDRESFGGRRVSTFLSQRRLMLEPIMEVDDIEAIVRMVAQGLGVALVPLGGPWCERVEGVRIHTLEAPDFCRELMLVTRTPIIPGGAVDLLRECLTQAVSVPS